MHSRNRLTKAILVSTVLLASSASIADVQVISTPTTNPVVMGVPSPLIQTLTVNDLGSLKASFANGVQGEAVNFNHFVPGNPETVFVNVNATTANSGVGIESKGDTSAAIRINANANASISNSTMVLNIGPLGWVRGEGKGIEDVNAIGGTGNSTLILNNRGTLEATIDQAIIDSDRSIAWDILNQKSGVIKGGTNNPALSLGLSTIGPMARLENQGLIIADRTQIAIAANNGQVITSFINSGTITGKTGVDISGSATNFSNSGIINAGSAQDPAVIMGTGVFTITGGQVKGLITEGGAGGNAVIKVAVGAGNVFNTEGNIDNVADVRLESGTLSLNHDITTKGKLTLLDNTTLVVNGNRTVVGKLDIPVKTNIILSLTSPTVFGKINAGAASDIKGTVTVTANTAQYIPDNTAFVLFQAGGAITEDTVPVYKLPNSAILSYTRAFTGNAVTITAKRNPINSMVNNPKAFGALAAFLEVLGKTSTDLDVQAIVGGFSALPDVLSVNRALQELSPQVNGANLRTAAAGHVLGLNTVQKRLTMARMEEKLDALGHPDSDMPRGYAAGSVFSESSDRGAWTQAYVQHGKEKERETIIGYNTDIRGLTVGYDRRVTDKIRLGAAFSYLNSKYHNDGRPILEDKINSYQGSLYSEVDFGTPWVEALLSYTTDSHNTRRQIAYGFINRVALSEHRGFQWSYQVSYNFPFVTQRNLEIVPLLKVAYHYAKERMNTEYNAGMASLRVQEQRLSALEYGVGLKFLGTHYIKNGVFLPDFHMGVQYDVQQHKPIVTAAFVGIPGSFAVQGPQDPHWSANAGVGLMFKIDNIRTSLNYEVTRKHHFLGHGGFLNVRFDL